VTSVVNLIKMKLLKGLLVLIILILISSPVKAQKKTKEFKLALIQMYVEPGNLQKNLSHAYDLITEAAAGGADFILMPEVLDLGWTHPSAKEQAGAIPGGKAFNSLADAAKKNKVWLCCGIVEKDGDEIYNAAVIIDDKGVLQIKHRKLNELDIAHDIYAQGDRLNVCKTPWGTIGLMICADGTAIDHVLARSLCYMGADVILSPSSWAVPPDHDNKKDPYGKTWKDAYLPVAKEFSVWIASASNVGPVTEGPWKYWKCIGCSLIIGPDGKEKLIGPYGENAEKIMFYSINPVSRPARGTGWYKTTIKD
jgi:predicted amidohydrolase